MSTTSAADTVKLGAPDRLERLAQQISEALVDAALAHGGQDNVTVVLAQYAVAT